MSNVKFKITSRYKMCLLLIASALCISRTNGNKCYKEIAQQL
jgi:hypothetical protein